jgi:hypothetical protein
MYATSGIEHIIRVPSEDMVGRSFYSCISRPCLSNAVECMETVKVKGDELIAHLRFQRRGPHTDDESGDDSSYGTKAKSAYGEWRAPDVEAFMSCSSDGIVVILRHASSVVLRPSQSW